jgi:anion-transporting  ArsA/GET3 family ATPase
LRILDDRRVLVCVGAGGVGKTSIAAALALAASRRGRRSLVVTIDPARRLASALGLETLGDTPNPVRGAPGLEAMMLDQKRAWDRLVARHAPTADARERILGNRFYRNVSGAFAGAHEYLALEELAALAEAGRHEMIVVDTPPAVHAFEFLDAPSRLAGLLDRRLLRWAAGSTPRIGRTARFFASMLESGAGGGTLHEVADLVGAMGGMFDTLTRRAKAVRDLLHDRRTGVVLVAAPDTVGVRQAMAARERLRAVKLAPAAVIVNRAHPRLPDGPDADAAELARAGIGGPLEWIADNARAHRRLAEAEQRRVDTLAPSAVVRALDSDIADLAGLSKLVELLGG